MLSWTISLIMGERNLKALYRISMKVAVIGSECSVSSVGPPSAFRLNLVMNPCLNICFISAVTPESRSFADRPARRVGLN